MRILGVTGSIGMGKSVAATMLQRRRVAVHDADRAVHIALARGGAAVGAVGRAFPGVVVKGAVDRRRLADRVFGDPAALKRLETILHPLARQSAIRFLAVAARRRAKIVALDIPLLFETHGQGGCDAVAVLSAPAFLQRQRVLRRPAMTSTKFQSIVARQMPDAEKRRRADFVVPSGLGRGPTWRQLGYVIGQLKQRAARAWSPAYARRRAA